MRKIRDFVIGLIFIGALVLILAIGGYSDTHYTQIAQVLTVDETGSTFVDGAGYVWAVYDTDYKVGQTVKIYFDNNTTDYTRNDDIIVKVKTLDN